MTDEAGGWAVTLEADRCDQVGCLAWELTVRLNAPPAAGLQAWADGIAGRVTGLLEPLRVVEVDGLRREAQLRSEQPGRRADQLFYYEVLVREPGLVTVRRYQAAQAPGITPNRWTPEEEEKLASDFDAGKSVDEIVRGHTRSRAAIEARLVKLGRLDPSAVTVPLRYPPRPPGGQPRQGG